MNKLLIRICPSLKMKRFAIASISFFIFLTAFAFGDTDGDSLDLRWQDPSQPAELRIKSMNYACDQVLLRSDPDSAYNLAKIMIELADSIKNKVYKAEALRIQGESYHFRGDMSQALILLQESLELSTSENYYKGRAKAYSCIGNIFTEQGKYTQALDFYKKSYDISSEISDHPAMSNTLIAMGIIFYDQGDSPRSLTLFERALKLNQESDDVRGMGRINNNIGVIYHELENYIQAQQYFETALNLFEQAGEKRGMASSLNNLGDVFASQGKYKEALPFNLKSLEMRKTLEDKRGMANCYNVIGDNLTQQGRYDEALNYYYKSIKIREELDEKRAMSRVYASIGRLYLVQKNYNDGNYWCKKAYELSNSIGAKIEERESCDCLYKIHKEIKSPDIALKYHERLMELEHDLKTELTAKTLQELEFKKIVLEDSLKKEQEYYRIELRHKEELNQKNKQRNIFLFIGLAILMLSAGLYSRLRFIRKSRTLIQQEKDRSDELLLNILPSKTADELKAKGTVNAQYFEMVTVMFTDFKGFTKIAENLIPQDLVNEIDYCFKKFDEIVTKHNIEKIKTIGDAYMCAGGLPVSSTTHAHDVVKAAQEIQHFMQDVKRTKEKQNKPYFELRIGIHTGPVVAGIVGTKKFQYDIWGDTVNIASRMESSGEVGKVNISQTTYDKIKDQFNCKYRGKIKAKNKGAIDMYFVNSEISI